MWSKTNRNIKEIQHRGKVVCEKEFENKVLKKERERKDSFDICGFKSDLAGLERKRCKDGEK